MAYNEDAPTWWEAEIDHYEQTVAEEYTLRKEGNIEAADRKALEIASSEARMRARRAKEQRRRV